MCAIGNILAVSAAATVICVAVLLGLLVWVNERSVDDEIRR
jgi:hypothetical protein